MSFDIAALIARYNAMTSEEQKAAHLKMQRRSWVIGEMMLSHPEMTRQQVERLVDHAEIACAPASK